MRIIAGKLKGKKIKAPKGSRTHPMSEKIRGALFNSLGDIDGLSVLDAYSGTGALSFEAVSRGAKHATAVEIDKHAVNLIKDSLADLGIYDQVKVIRANITGWSHNNPKASFDIVLADPPFDKIKPDALWLVSKHMNKSGIFCLNWPGGQDLPEIDGINIIAEKNYGDATLGFYKRTRPQQ